MQSYLKPVIIRHVEFIRGEFSCVLTPTKYQLSSKGVYDPVTVILQTNEL